MIPVKEQQLIKVNLKISKNDSAGDKHYKQLCIDELNWCRKNSDTIINKANCLYNLLYRGIYSSPFCSAAFHPFYSLRSDCYTRFLFGPVS